MSSPEVVIEKATHKRKFGRVKEGKVISIEMTKSCARDLTDRIKTAVDDVADMLYRAHQGKAWAALGYQSWKEYCTAEFQMSERHSYRLLDFVEIKNVLADQLVSPTSESQVRPLTKLDPEQQPVVWESAVEIADGEQPTAKQVEQVVVEILPPKKMDNAMIHADKAIRCLERISYDDSDRAKAMKQVERWIGLHRGV